MASTTSPMPSANPVACGKPPRRCGDHWIFVEQKKIDFRKPSVCICSVWQQQQQGKSEESRAFLEQSKQIFIEENDQQGEGLTELPTSPSTPSGFPPTPKPKPTPTVPGNWRIHRVERDFIRSACRQGQAALALGDHATAHERLHHALTRARAIQYVEEELPALTALAELARQQGDPKLARELLADVWEAAERGPYPLEHADACNVLCQIERDAGNQAAAIEAAEAAFRLAWCGEGPPWAYHFGLENARRHLRELGWSEGDFAGLEARANASK